MAMNRETHAALLLETGAEQYNAGQLANFHDVMFDHDRPAAWKVGWVVAAENNKEEVKNPTTSMMVGGELVDIDDEIVGLITLMNAIDGIETINSCQDGYVHFGGLNAAAFLRAMLDEREYADLFSIEMLGATFCIMWGPDVRPLVFTTTRPTTTPDRVEMTAPTMRLPRPGKSYPYRRVTRRQWY